MKTLCSIVGLRSTTHPGGAAAGSRRDGGRRAVRCLAALAMCAAVFAFDASVAHAQEQKVSPTGKGIAGGVLLGAEVVMITEAIIGVDTWWPYVVFGIVGGAGGGVGGYFVEIESAEPEPSLYMLAGGMALLIPALVATLNATAYSPEEPGEGEQDVTNDGEGGGSTLTVEKVTLAPTLLDVSPRGLALGAPGVHVRPAYTNMQMAKYGLEQVPELHVPVFGGSF